MLNVQEKVSKFMAVKYGYLPGRAKQLKAFATVMFNFSQYLGSNKYYSDVLNRRIALASLDVDLFALRAEKLRVEAEEMYALVTVALLAKKKPGLDAKAVAAFQQELDAAWVEARRVHALLIDLMGDIKKEYAQTR